MRLAPRGVDQLPIHVAAEAARRRRARTSNVDHAESAALIRSEPLQETRDARSVADRMGHGAAVLAADDVLASAAKSRRKFRGRIVEPRTTFRCRSGSTRRISSRVGREREKEEQGDDDTRWASPIPA